MGQEAQKVVAFEHTLHSVLVFTNNSEHYVHCPWIEHGQPEGGSGIPSCPGFFNCASSSKIQTNMTRIDWVLLELTGIMSNLELR
jgi:hypothetical protein